MLPANYTKTIEANQLSLGSWDNVRDFANKHQRKLLLAANDFAPTPDRWEFMLLEVKPDDTLEFAADIYSNSRPDEINVTSDGKWLRLWWD